jgi:hypothetical protein
MRKYTGSLVDPLHFTNYHRSMPQLQATLLFSALVAGKAALPTARALTRLLDNAFEKRRTLYESIQHRGYVYPFPLLRPFNVPQLATMLREAGIGCYNRKCVTVHEIVRCGLNIKKCTLQELEQIHGIGPKTSRFFVLHSRPNQRLAVLDVHILEWLRDMGYDAPTHTPSSARRYAELERIFLRYADKADMSPADLDLRIWRQYRNPRNREVSLEERRSYAFAG